MQQSQERKNRTKNTNPPNGDGETGHKGPAFIATITTENEGSLQAFSFRKENGSL
jgi:hypothetical protein